MGTVIRAGGFRVVIPVDDHQPSHVHVFGDGEAKINIIDADVVWSIGFKKADVKKIVKLVTENRAYLIEQWNLTHG